MLSVSPDNTVSNNWLIMIGQGYGRQWSWPNLHEREKPKKYQSYVPDQIKNRILQNTSEHYFFSQLALCQNVSKWKLPDNLHANCQACQNMCTDPVGYQISQRIMKEECEKHGTVTYCNHVQHTYLNPQPSLTPCDNNKLSSYPS
jgi:hypothetical protein